MGTLYKERLGAIAALARSKIFVLVTDEETTLVGDFGKGFQGQLMISAIKKVRARLQEVLDQQEAQSTKQARAKPKKVKDPKSVR